MVYKPGMYPLRLLAVLSLAGCATELAARVVPAQCPPPPPPIYSSDCLHKGDVLNVADQILKETEQHASRLVELEKSLVGLQEDMARALVVSLNAVPAGEASVAVVGGRVRVRLSDGLLFPSGSAQLGAPGLRALDRVADVLRTTPSRRIEVAGHTDSRPVQKQWEDNWQLSTERARQVGLFLMTRGLEGRRLLIAGYADTDPIDTEDSVAGRARNRRVELFIEATAPQPQGGDLDDPKR